MFGSQRYTSLGLLRVSLHSQRVRGCLETTPLTCTISTFECIVGMSVSLDETPLTSCKGGYILD